MPYHWAVCPLASAILQAEPMMEHIVEAIGQREADQPTVTIAIGERRRHAGQARGVVVFVSGGDRERRPPEVGRVLCAGENAQAIGRTIETVPAVGQASLELQAIGHLVRRQRAPMRERSGELVAVRLGKEKVTDGRQPFVADDRVEVAELRREAGAADFDVRLRNGEAVVLRIPVGRAVLVRLHADRLREQVIFAVEQVDAAAGAEAVLRQRDLRDQVALVEHRLVAAIDGVVRTVEAAAGAARIADESGVEPAGHAEATFAAVVLSADPAVAATGTTRATTERRAAAGIATVQRRALRRGFAARSGHQARFFGAADERTATEPSDQQETTAAHIRLPVQVRATDEVSNFWLCGNYGFAEFSGLCGRAEALRPNGGADLVNFTAARDPRRRRRLTLPLLHGSCS